MGASGPFLLIELDGFWLSQVQLEPFLLDGNLHPVLFAHFRGPGHSGLFQPFCLLREDLLLDTVCGR